MQQVVRKILDVPSGRDISHYVAAMACIWEATQLLLPSLGVKRDLFKFDEGSYRHLPGDGVLEHPDLQLAYTNVGPHRITMTLNLWEQPHPGALSPLTTAATNICAVAQFSRRRPEVTRVCEDFANLMGNVQRLEAIMQRWPLRSPAVERQYQ